MPDGMLTLGDLASQIRSKNAGPFWITLDIFFKDEADYRFVTTSAALSQQAIARLYQVDPATVKYFELPNILALRSPSPAGHGRQFPRPRPPCRPAARSSPQPATPSLS